MKLAISSCLLGNNVRYDGTNKKDTFILDALSKYFEFIPFCPEDLAYGTPRPTIRLYKESQTANTIVQTSKTSQDISTPLFRALESEITKLDDSGLCGVIFKAKSPSCGFGSAKIYYPNNQIEGKQDGLFASLVKERYPMLPKEEEARLNDAWLKENFIMAIFALKELKSFLISSPTYKELIEFHTSYKYLLHAKDERAYRELGNIVANHDKEPLESLLIAYERLFIKAINTKSSIGKTINVLEHIIGFFKKEISKDEKSELLRLIEDYRKSIIPLITVIEAIKIYVNRYDIAFLKVQRFLDPYPRELGLRSDISAGK